MRTPNIRDVILSPPPRRTKNLRRGDFLRTIAFILFLSFIIPAVYAAETPDLSLEDIAKTDAARFFLERQYEDSLKAFQVLEAEHPQNILIKRYVASLLDTLHQVPQAVLKLHEVLALAPEDLVARQMLGELFVKQAEFEKAAQEFRVILEKDPESRMGQYAKARLQSLEALERSAQISEAGGRMAAKDFMRSEPARDFSSGKFEKALAGFEALQIRFPEEPLIQRFRGLALMKLGKKEEAFAAFDQGVKKFPDNIAMRYYLAESLVGLGKMEEARHSLQTVIEKDAGTYRAKAEQMIFYTLQGQAPPKPKPWTVYISNGYEYDTNATYRADDPEERVPGDQNSGRYSSIFSGTYQFYQKGRHTVTGDGFYAQSLYDDFINLNTYTPGGGVSLLSGFSLFNRPAYLNLREGQSLTYLKDVVYLWSNTLSPSFIYMVSRMFKTTLGYRWSYNDYTNDGTAPSYTNRDGNAHTATILNTHYLNDTRKLYYSFGYDFDYANTKGVNYQKYGHALRGLVHAPLFEKVEGELSYIFKESDYPKYGYSGPKRLDDVHTLTITLSRPIRTWLILNGLYIFENARSKNNAYQYFKHVFGVKINIQY